MYYDTSILKQKIMTLVGVEALKVSANRIYYLMSAHLMTQGNLAEMAGVSRATINSALLKGSCSTTTAGKIAKALGVDPIDIIED